MRSLNGIVQMQEGPWIRVVCRSILPEIAHRELETITQDALGHVDQFRSHEASTLDYENLEWEGVMREILWTDGNMQLFTEVVYFL